MRTIISIALGVMMVILGVEAAVRTMSHQLPDWRPWPTPESAIKADQLHASDGSVDVVFLGSSVVEGGIDPVVITAVTSMSAYNAALPFSTPLSDEVWLEHFVLDALQPEIVVVGLANRPYDSTADDDLLRAGLLRVVEASRRSFLDSELLRRRQQLRNWSDTMARLRMARSGAITSRGQQTAYLDLQRGSAEVAQNQASRGDVLSADNRRALQRIIEGLIESDIQVVILIEPPGCPPIIQACPRVDPENHPGRVTAAQYGLSLIDSSVLDWPDELYADSAHLNRRGARAYSEFVAERLHELSGVHAARDGD